MKSWRRATLYFILGYLVAMIGGFWIYYTFSESVLRMFTTMFVPALYIFLCYRYLSDAGCGHEHFLDNELIRLTASWTILSVILDAIAYVFIIPLILGYSLNWTFFRDHSPWIWLEYASIIVITAIGKLLHYLRNKRRAPTT